MRSRALVLFVLFTAITIFVAAIYTNADAAPMKLLARAEASWIKGNLEKVIMALIDQATPIALSTMCAVVNESETGRPLELEPRVTLRNNAVIVELYANCSFKKDLTHP